MDDHLALLGKALQLLLVKAIGINEDARPVNDGGVLLVAEKNFVAPEVTIWATRLHLPDRRRIQVELAIDALDVLAH